METTRSSTSDGIGDRPRDGTGAGDSGLFYDAPIGLVTLERDGRIRRANGLTEEILGAPAAELAGTPFADRVSRADRSAFEVLLAEVLHGTGRARAEVALRWGADRVVPSALSASEEPGGAGRILLAIAAATQPSGPRAFDRARSRVLREVARGAPLEQVLRALVLAVEDVVPGMVCSVLLVDAARGVLGSGVAPSLPEEYNRAVDGLAIRDPNGSCGTAAARGERIVVADIDSHPYWEPYRELARAAGVRACWSEPIRSAVGEVIGTFAMYYADVREPGAFELGLIADAADVAGIAIESRRSTAERDRLQDLLRQIVDLVPHMIFAKDWDGRLLLGNEALASAYQQPIEELIGKRHADVHADPAELERMLSDDREVMRSGRPKFIAEESFLRADGELRYLDTTKIPFTTAGADQRAVLGVAVDVTDRKRAELDLKRAKEELEHRVRGRTRDLQVANERLVAEIAERRAVQKDLAVSQARMKAVLASSPAVIYSCEAAPPYATTFVSENVQQLLGYPRSAFLANPSFWAESVHPDDRERVLAGIPEGVREHVHEYRAVRADGSTLWVRDALRFVASGGDGAGELVGCVVDISDQKLLEQSLRSAEERWRYLIENIPDEILLLDARGRITVHKWSGVLEQAEFESEEVIFDRTPPEQRAWLRDVLERASRTGEPLSFELPLSASDGTLRRYACRLVAIRRHPADDTLLWVGTDITDQVELERQLRTLEDELAHAARLSTAGELAGQLAHEVNQPLTAITNYAGTCRELLKREVPDLDAVRESLRGVSTQALRAGDIVRNLRAFVRKREPDRTRLDLRETIEEAVLLLRPEARKRRVEVVCAADDELPAILADRVQIQQVLVNLVKNAVEGLSAGTLPTAEPAAEDGPRVLVEARRTVAGMVEVRVLDNGPGLPESDPERIFAPFYSSKQDGMGLGLAIARTIVESHGGHIYVCSQPAGWTVIAFTLPAS